MEVGQFEVMKRGSRSRPASTLLLACLLMVLWVGVTVHGDDHHHGGTIQIEHHHGHHGSIVVRADCPSDLQSSPFVLLAGDTGAEVEFFTSWTPNTPIDDDRVPDLHGSARASPRAPPSL